MARKKIIIELHTPTLDGLIESVRRGELTPVDAERRAAELGLPPLINSPNENDFDPLVEPFWSIPMVLAWVGTRDADSVRTMWDRWRLEKEFWSWSRWQVPGEPVNEGYWIKRLGPAGLIDLAVATAVWQTEGKLITVNATAELLKALQAGAIQATGLASLGEPRTPIAAYLWRDLDFYESNHRVVARTMSGLGLGFDDVAFESKSVRAHWPPIHAKVKATAGAETRAKAALAAELRANKHMRRETAQTLCMSEYGVSKRGFLNRVWPDAREAAGLSRIGSRGRKKA